MYAILIIAVAWLAVFTLFLAMFRCSAQADRAAERHRRARGAALMLAAVPLAAAAAPNASAASCANARRAPGLAGPQATLCLVNAERRARSLPALSANPRLARAARHHAADMVTRRYFAHDSPGGSTFIARLRHVGYPGGCAWSAGETLAWGARAGQGSPAARVAGWMHSPPHRQILLDRGFRDLGIGIAAGAPDGSPGGFTYVGEFGRRRC